MSFLSKLFGKKAAPEQQMNHYGLILTDDKAVKYEGVHEDIELNGDDIPDYISSLRKRASSFYAVILPQMGFVVFSKEGRNIGFKFKSPMSKDSAAKFLADATKEGVNVKIFEEFGAFEFKY